MEQIPEAVTRTETFISAILDRLNGGEGNPGITPVTRTEIFLAAILEIIPAMVASISSQVLRTINDAMDSAMNKDRLISDKVNPLVKTNFG